MAAFAQSESSVAAPADAPATAPTTTAPTTTAPTTQPVFPPNYLRTPHRALNHFLTIGREAAAIEDEAARRAKLTDGMLALDFREVDPETVRADGPEYVEKLAVILERLIDEGFVDPNDKEVLPDEPTGTVSSFGLDPMALQLVRMPRIVVAEGGDPATAVSETLFEWRFPALVVRDIPTWFDELESRIARVRDPLGVDPPPSREQAAAVGLDFEAMRTAGGALRFFLETYSRTAADGDLYAALWETLDFTEVARNKLRDEGGIDDPIELDRELKRRGPAYVAELRKTEGIRYVDALHAVLQAMLDSQSFALKDLPEDASAYVKPTWSIEWRTHPGTLITLVRQGPRPGLWRFSAKTVKDLPAMVALVREQTVPAKTPAPAPAVVGAAPPTVTPPPAPVPAAVAPGGDALPENTRSPRATLETFLLAMQRGDIETAVRTLDLSQLTAAEQELADILAGKLWLTMMRAEKVLPSEVSDQSDAAAQDPLPPTRVEGRIVLRRVRVGPRQGEWLFSSRTVRDIEALYEAVEREPIHKTWEDAELSARDLPSLWVRETLVPPEFKVRTLLLWRWQWIGLGALLIAGILALLVFTWLFSPIAQRMLRTRDVAIMPHVVRRTFRPLGYLVMLTVWWAGLQLLDLPQAMLTRVLWVLRIAMLLATVTAIYRIIDITANYWNMRIATGPARIDSVVVPLLDRTLKVVAVALGAIFLLNAAFAIDSWRLIAGLGVGGLAVAFAAQDTIKNFFGSVNVVLDQPFKVGDWVKVGDHEGTVEAVGLRSTRIRTFYKSQVIVPNSEIMNAVVDNMERRPVRRFKTYLSVTYDTTPEALEAFSEGVRELIRKHPHTYKDAFHVYVNDFGASSIDILLYCFFEVKSWGQELRERQRLIVDIVRLAERLGVEFAFPTQTVHFFREQHRSDRMAHVPRQIPQAEDLARREAGSITHEFLPPPEDKK